MSSENFLDFIQGLTAKIGGLKQLIFGALDKITNVVNIFCLKAVSGTNGKFKIVNRTEKDRIERWRRFFFRFLVIVRSSILMDRTKDSKLILKNTDSFTKCIFWTNGTIGLNRHFQLVEVGALSNASSLNLIGNALNRREGSIHNDATNTTLRVVIVESTDITRLIAATLFNLHLHLKATTGEMSDHMFGVNHRNIMRKLKVGCCDNTFAILTKDNSDFVSTFKLEDNALEI